MYRSILYKEEGNVEEEEGSEQLISPTRGTWAYKQEIVKYQ